MTTTKRIEIINLIWQELSGMGDRQYIPNGMTQVIDPQVISLHFKVRAGGIEGDMNLCGFMGDLVTLKAQYGLRSTLNDHPRLQEQIGKGLVIIMDTINQSY